MPEIQVVVSPTAGGWYATILDLHFTCPALMRGSTRAEARYPAEAARAVEAGSGLPLPIAIFADWPFLTRISGDCASGVMAPVSSGRSPESGLVAGVG